VRAFSPDTRITQRDGGQGSVAPGSRSHVPGPQPPPAGAPAAGWARAGACPPDRPRSPGTRPSQSPSSSLGGIKASRPELPLAPAPW